MQTIVTSCDHYAARWQDWFQLLSEAL